MKKLLMLFVALCGTFISCSDDDDDKKFEGNEKAFIGTSWENTYYTSKDGIELKYEIEIKFHNENKISTEMEMSKKVDGDFIDMNHYYNSGTYSVSENKLLITVFGEEGNKENYSKLMTISGNKFSYTENGETFFFILE